VEPHEYHRDCGRHSGIPVCCTEWYLGPWEDVSAVPYLWKAYWKANFGGTEKPDYIRCPPCIESNLIVEVRECECHVSR